MRIIEELLDLALLLANKLKDANEYNIKVKSLLERLAPEECAISSIADQEGDYDAYCFYCGADAFLSKDNYNIKHAPDCPWVEARKLLEELK
jgi:hypothetical protein